MRHEGAMPPHDQPRILHIHSTFKLGGKEARTVELMNAWGDAFAHDIVSGDPAGVDAHALIGAHVPARMVSDFPPLAGGLELSRLRAIGRYLREKDYDLVLTYNFGAMDVVLANRLFARLPHVHHEDGFNEDEAVRQKPARILYRRLALPHADRLVVPSRNLERIALEIWRQPRRRVAYVPNGVDMSLFDEPPAPDAVPGLVRLPGEVLVGTLAGLRAVKNLPRLVRGFAAATRSHPEVPARLVIVGSGPEEARVRAEAAAQGVADRLVMPGFLAYPHRYVGLFDIFALSSDSEQFPISLVEAMAAGLPAVSTRVGDVASIVDPENLPFVADVADEQGFGEALARLLADAGLRRHVGAANRARVARQFTKRHMVESYAAIYAQAMRRPAFSFSAR